MVLEHYWYLIVELIQEVWLKDKELDWMGQVLKVEKVQLGVDWLQRRLADFGVEIVESEYVGA